MIHFLRVSKPYFVDWVWRWCFPNKVQMIKNLFFIKEIKYP